MLFAQRSRDWAGARLRNWLWPRQGLKRTGRYYAHRIARMRGSDHWIAAGLASGISMSFMPIGLHVVMALALALIVRGSTLAALLATVIIGNPLVVALLLAADIKLGQWLLGGVAHPDMAMGASWTEMLMQPLALLERIGLPFMLGAFILALMAWFIGYYGIRLFIRQRRQARLAARSRK